MTDDPAALDVDAILGSLKDFQRTSVEYVFQRLYLDDKARPPLPRRRRGGPRQDPRGTGRFMLSDSRRTALFEDLLGTYRPEALTCADGDLSGLREAKGQLELVLRRVMIRTERLGVTSCPRASTTSGPPSQKSERG